MPAKNYWLDLFTGITWKEFQAHGARVSGFRESRWTTMQKMTPGDILLCYLTGVSRFIGFLEMVGKPYKGSERIWNDDTFPCRVDVKPVVMLTPETGLPVYDFRDRLSCFTEAKTPVAWTGAFRGSPSRWKESDGKIIVEALLAAQRNPKTLPTDPRKLARKPRAFLTKSDQAVTIPEPEEIVGEKTSSGSEPREHTEVQSLLLQLGADMGFEVWVAKNDRNREHNGKRFSDLPKLKQKLPLQFDDATNRTIELIDVLWLKGNSIVAAFEIESTTSIYSGLLRMSDLVAMQPNLNIPLYIVAPEERRDKVFAEINRPTFLKLNPPISEICRFISFQVLRERLKEVKGVLKYLKAEFLEELSEPCVIEE